MCFLYWMESVISGAHNIKYHALLSLSLASSISFIHTHTRRSPKFISCVCCFDLLWARHKYTANKKSNIRTLHAGLWQTRRGEWEREMWDVRRNCSIVYNLWLSFFRHLIGHNVFLLHPHRQAVVHSAIDSWNVCAAASTEWHFFGRCRHHRTQRQCRQQHQQRKHVKAISNEFGLLLHCWALLRLGLLKHGVCALFPI